LRTKSATCCGLTRAKPTTKTTEKRPCQQPCSGTTETETETDSETPGEPRRTHPASGISSGQSCGGSHKELQQQYLYERNAIKSEREIARLTAQQQALITELKADNAALRQTVQTSTTRTIEVVALFIAAIAFAVGSLQVTLVGTLSLKDRTILLGIFGVGLLLFAVVIVGATWTITRVRKR
jgi:hypothetical protein